MAWKGLAGYAGKEEIIEEMHKEGVRRAVETNRRNQTGLFDPAVRAMSPGGFGAAVKNNPNFFRDMSLRAAEKNRGCQRTEETKAKMRAAKPKGVYSNKGRTPESRQIITMSNIDGRVETHPQWKWREMTIRYDRAGIGRLHDKGWQFPHCPLNQHTNEFPDGV
jgi:hypothetical protein